MQRASLAAALVFGLAWSLSPRAAAGPATAMTQVPTDPYQVRTVCTTPPVSGGRRVEVANGSDLQRPLDTAVAGDTIVLAAGATYRPTNSDGSFTLRNRGVPAGQWIVIRSGSTMFD